jgi:phospholipid/cholesterol/gamma-HCH transport system ATP-binding protein
MQKRIAIARALVLNPEVILFDEPCAGLDPVVSSVVDELIVALTEKTKATSIIVTHEMDSAFRVATRMAMLYKGEIIEEGLPDRFRNSKNPIVAQFVEGDTNGPISTQFEPLR